MISSSFLSLNRIQIGFSPHSIVYTMPVSGDNCQDHAEKI